MALAESAIFAQTLGADVSLEVDDDLRLDGVLFGEAQSRIVCSTPASNADAVSDALAGQPVRALRIGTVTDGSLHITVNSQSVIDAAPADLAARYEEAIPARMSS
jgi:phosphoribosylformylglycinamidine synthase